MAELGADHRSDLIVGFLAFQVPSDTSASGRFRGALLVTDYRGDPLEFEVSSPVEPSRVQRAIWGDALTRHVVTDVLAAPLLAQMRHRPHLMLTNRLEALLAPSEVITAHLHPNSDPPQPELPHGVLHRSVAGKRLSNCLTTGLSATESELEEISNLMQRLDLDFNPLDAFDRINRALNELKAINK